jgi:hypothetical protein
MPLRILGFLFSCAFSAGSVAAEQFGYGSTGRSSGKSTRARQNDRADGRVERAKSQKLQ